MINKEITDCNKYDCPIHNGGKGTSCKDDYEHRRGFAFRDTQTQTMEERFDILSENDWQVMQGDKLININQKKWFKSELTSLINAILEKKFQLIGGDIVSIEDIKEVAKEYGLEI